MAKVGVVGTTSWGTTLAIILARQGLDVCLWARTEDEAAQLRAKRRNLRCMPEIAFPPNLSVTSSTRDAFEEAELLIIAVPSRTLRINTGMIRDSLGSATLVLSASKGLERKTGKRMSEILEEELSSAIIPRICALSGPNLADEIIKEKPCATIVASRDLNVAKEAQAIINSPRLRVYTSQDIVGVEYGGALKNIIALGAGICDGLRLGDNAKAAFITRGLAEIGRFSVAAGADPMTFSGLAGIGDVIATCSSSLSRNHRVGELLAQGKKLGEIRNTVNNVAEGIDTTFAIIPLADKLGVEMPIAQATYDVLFGEVPLDQAISGLMVRAPGSE